MDLQKFCDFVGFDDKTRELLSGCWDQLLAATADTKGMPFFLTLDFFLENYRAFQFQESIIPRVKSVLATVEKYPDIARYADMLHYGLYRAQPAVNVKTVPHLEKIFGENAGVFQILVAMSSLPYIRETHQKLGLPEKYTVDSVSWLGASSRGFAAQYGGIPGHFLLQSHWMRNHINGTLFRIGRFEFMTGGQWNADLPLVFRSRKSGELVVLCNQDWYFNSKNLRVSSNDPDLAFTTKVRVLDNKIYGTSLLPTGFPEIGSNVELDLDEWAPEIMIGDTIVAVHIPAGRLDTDESRASFQEAKIFFRKYLKTEVKAFICYSWLFNPVWEKEIPDSNIVAFQRNVFLAPSKLDKEAGLFFVYGHVCDPREVPATTSIHHAFRRIAERGEDLRQGWMFLLADDVDRYGSDVYRSGMKK